MIAAEALWLIYLWLFNAEGGDRARGATSWKIGVALAAALVLLLPFFAALRYGVEGVARGDYDWINHRVDEPSATFESGLGTLPFPVFALLAIMAGFGSGARSR